MAKRIKIGGSYCEAGDPKTCSYHGAFIKAEDALKRGDYEAYEDARITMTLNAHKEERVGLAKLLRGKVTSIDPLAQSFDAQFLKHQKHQAKLLDQLSEIDSNIATLDAKKKKREQQ